MNDKEILNAFNELKDNDYDIYSCPSSLDSAWVESLSLLCTGDRNVIPSKEQLRMQHTAMTVSHMSVMSRPLDEGLSANRRRYSPELLARVWNEVQSDPKWKPPAGLPPTKEVVDEKPRNPGNLEKHTFFDDVFKKMATESIRRYRTTTSDGVPYPMIVGPKTLETLRQMDGWIELGQPMKMPEDFTYRTRRLLQIDGGPNSHGWRPWRLIEIDVTEPESEENRSNFYMTYTSEIRTLDTYHGTRLPLLKRLLWNFTIWRYKLWTGK